MTTYSEFLNAVGAKLYHGHEFTRPSHAHDAADVALDLGLVEPDNGASAVATKFRVGDKVRIIGSRYAEELNVGKVGKVVVNTDDEGIRVDFRKRDRYGVGEYADHDFTFAEDLEILVPVLEAGDRVRVKNGKLSKVFHIDGEPEALFNGAEGVIGEVDHADEYGQTHEVRFDTEVPDRDSSWYFSPKDLIRL